MLTMFGPCHLNEAIRTWRFGSAQVDVLKLHTNGGERQILDGASELFEKNQVHGSICLPMLCVWL